jgi:hypothetical protein
LGLEIVNFGLLLLKAGEKLLHGYPGHKVLSENTMCSLCVTLPSVDGAVHRERLARGRTLSSNVLR